MPCDLLPSPPGVLVVVCVCVCVSVCTHVFVSVCVPVNSCGHVCCDVYVQVREPPLGSVLSVNQALGGVLLFSSAGTNWLFLKTGSFCPYLTQRC